MSSSRSTTFPRSSYRESSACEVCATAFGIRPRHRCVKCDNIICDDCSRNASGDNHSNSSHEVVCSDCEFFGHFEKAVKKKDAKGGSWLKGGFWAKKTKISSPTKIHTKDLKMPAKTPVKTPLHFLQSSATFTKGIFSSHHKKTPHPTEITAFVHLPHDSNNHHHTVPPSPGGISDILQEKERETRELKTERNNLLKKVQQLEEQVKILLQEEENHSSEITQAVEKALEQAKAEFDAALMKKKTQEEEEKEPLPEPPTSIEADEKLLEKIKVLEEENAKISHAYENLKLEHAQLQAELVLAKEKATLVENVVVAVSNTPPPAEVLASEVQVKTEEKINTIPTPPPLPPGTVLPPLVQEELSAPSQKSTIPTPPPLPPGTVLSNSSSSLEKPSSKIPIPPPLPANNSGSTSVPTVNGKGPGLMLPPNLPARPPRHFENSSEQPAPQKLAKLESIRKIVHQKSSKLAANAGGELRPVFWNPLNATKVQGTIWAELNVDGASPEIKDSEIDHFLKLEEKFAKPKVVENNATNTLQSTNSSSNNNNVSAVPLPIKAAPLRPKILDAARQQNIGIVMGSMIKNYGVQGIRDAILRVDRNILSFDNISKLLSNIPTPEETKMVEDLLNDHKEDPTFLKGMIPQEEFIFAMASVPRLRQRLQNVFFEMSFDRQSESLEEQVLDYESACQALKNSKPWKQLLQLVLLCGNYVNDGNASRGGAMGFELTTGLPKLAECKAGSKYSLLHWIAEAAETKCPEVFELPDQLSKLEAVEKVKIEDIKAELSQLNKGVSLLKREIDACNSAPGSLGAEEFVFALGPFLENTATPSVQKLSERVSALEISATGLVTFYGEKETVPVNKLFESIMSFVKSLVKARQEALLERSAAEQKKGKRLSSTLVSTAVTLEKQVKRNSINRHLKEKIGGVSLGIPMSEIAAGRAGLKKQGLPQPPTKI